MAGDTSALYTQSQGPSKVPDTGKLGSKADAILGNHPRNLPTVLSPDYFFLGHEFGELLFAKSKLRLEACKTTFTLHLKKHITLVYLRNFNRRIILGFI